MNYALNLADDFRILSATYEQFSAPGMSIVNELPDGDICDYKYIDSKYVYDPLSKEPETKGMNDTMEVRLTQKQYNKLMKLLEEDVK